MPAQIKFRWSYCAAWMLASVISFAQPVQVEAQNNPDQKFPDVVAVKATPRGIDTFDFDVTITSPYDTAQRYADAFRVLAADGKVLGERILLHDHADEQPFTRDLYGVKVPAGIKTVTVEGRDKANGWGGKKTDVALPGR